MSLINLENVLEVFRYDVSGFIYKGFSIYLMFVYL